MSMRCYKYFAIPASRRDSDLLHHQCRLAGDYRRALVDIENRQRDLLRALWAEPMRHLPVEERKAWREAGGDKVIKAWTSTDEYKEWRSRIQREAIAAGKLAYAAAGDAGLAWGTRLAVGEAIEQARRTTAWVDNLGHSGSNRVAVQIQITRPLSGLAVMDGEDTRLRIGREPYALANERADGFRARATGEVRNRGGNVRPHRLREAKLRIGSDGPRTPVWAALHVLMHRPLPDGQIKGAWAQRRRIGTVWRWEFVVSIDIGECIAPAHPGPEATCAVDLGWRRRDDGMRVAYWVGSNRARGELVVPIHVERRKSKSDDLRSIRDKARNEFAAKLRAWVTSHPGTWLDDATTYITKWAKTYHFALLEKRWKVERVPGDEFSFDGLVAFLKQDRHLHDWQAFNLVKMQRQIQGRFTEFAHWICSRFGVVAVEKLDLVTIKEMDLDQDPGRINAKSIQRLAPGELLRTIKSVAPKYGCVVHEIDPAYTTLRCSACGHIREVKDQSKLLLTCDSCGHADDQDRTAAINLLRASESLRDTDGKPLARANSPTSAKKLAPRRTRKRVVSQPLET